jgi:hypothetical protein
MAEVTYTRPFQTIGDDQPRPGTSTAHLTRSVVDHRVGTFVSEERPLPVGPRKAGHPVVVDADIGDNTMGKARRTHRARRTRMEAVFTNRCNSPSRPSRLALRAV